MTSAHRLLSMFHPELASLVEQAEQSLWTNPRAMLLQGRLFAERLAKIIAQESKVEPVYEIKQTDRLHMLERKGVIDADIRVGFEWLRMNGNTAAHEAKQVPPDIALTAHRHIYELSAWFTETYGPLTAEVPEYAMPLPPTSKVEGGLSAENLSAAFQQMIEEHVSGKLLSSINRKFQDIQDTLDKFAGSVEEWARKTVADAAGKSMEAVTIAAQQAKNEELVAAAEVREPGQGVEIAEYLSNLSLSVLDKRASGGALWVVGGWELKEIMFKLRPLGFYFRFARGGSQSTKRKPAWFLMGKDPTVRRYVNEAAEASADAVLPEPEAAKVSEVFSSELDNRGMSQATPAAAAQPEDDRKVGITEPGTVREEDVLIPQAIREKELADYEPSRLSEISQKMGIARFQDWSEERLKELYRKQPKLLHDVLVQLWFFGVEFRGELGRFLRLERAPGSATIELVPGVALAERLPLDVVRMLERFGIRMSDQLNGIPNASLEWLLRRRYSDTVQILEQWRQEPGQEEAGTEMETQPLPIEDEPEASAVLHFEGDSIEVPRQYLSVEIDSIPIFGCAALLHKVKTQGHMIYVRDLPADLSAMAGQFKGVGMGTVRKFYNQFSAYVSREVKEANFVSDQETPNREMPDRTMSMERQYKHQTASESGKIIWWNRVIELESGDGERELDKDVLARTPHLAVELHNRGIRKVGDLPTLVQQLQHIDGVGAAAVGKFLEQLESRLRADRLHRAMERQWEELPSEQRTAKRIAFAIDKIETDWLEVLSEEHIRKDRNLQMVHLRWKGRIEDRKPTLEQLGQQFQLTRERVRQIISKMLQKFHPDVKVLERVLKEACRHNHQYYRYVININEKFSHGLIEQVVEEYEGLLYLERYGWWTTRTLEAFEQEVDALRKSLSERVRGQVVSMEHIREIVSSLTDQLPVELGMQVVTPELQMTADGRYVWAGSKKSDIVEMVLRQYPEGVEVYKRARELCEHANRIRPGEFVRDREFTSVIQRDEFADTAYLWGRGTYIHSSFVKANVSLIEEVVHAAAELLEKRSPISVGRLFHAYQARLLPGGVPNEYALYTLLRKYGSNKLAPNKFPHIWHKDDAFQLSNGELIKAFLRERQEPQTIEALREEFVRRRGWKRFTLEFSITNDSDFVSANYGVVGLREFYPFHEHDFESMVQQLGSLLTETDVIHVNRLFDSVKDQCDRMGIGSSYLLYDLLQGIRPDAFRFARYPLICAEGHPLKDITLLTMVEQFIQEQEAEVPRELVYQWMTEEVGAKETTLDNVLVNSAQIYYYRGGQFGEYIHRSRLGWTEEKEEALISHVNACLEQALVQDRHYVTVKTMWVPYRFPTLANDLEWTEDLFIDCLRKSGKCRLLGSMDYIVVPLEHSRISDETNLIAHILESEFRGEAPLKTLQRKLADIRYSKDGTWLFETMSRLESGVAPFVVESDRVVLRTGHTPS